MSVCLSLSGSHSQHFGFSIPLNRIWNNTTLRSPKQQIWLRTALCGWWCRHMALHNLKSCMPETTTTTIPKSVAIFRRRPPNGGIGCKGVWKNCDFRPISRFVSELMHDRAIIFYGRRIGNHIQTFEWYQSEWPWVTSNPDFKVIIQHQITQKRYIR